MSQCSSNRGSLALAWLPFHPQTHGATGQGLRQDSVETGCVPGLAAWLSLWDCPWVADPVGELMTSHPDSQGHAIPQDLGALNLWVLPPCFWLVGI